MITAPFEGDLGSEPAGAGDASLAWQAGASVAEGAPDCGALVDALVAHAVRPAARDAWVCGFAEVLSSQPEVASAWLEPLERALSRAVTRFGKLPDGADPALAAAWWTAQGTPWAAFAESDQPNVVADPAIGAVGYLLLKAKLSRGVVALSVLPTPAYARAVCVGWVSRDARLLAAMLEALPASAVLAAEWRPLDGVLPVLWCEAVASRGQRMFDLLEERERHEQHSRGGEVHELAEPDHEPAEFLRSAARMLRTERADLGDSVLLFAACDALHELLGQRRGQRGGAAAGMFWREALREVATRGVRVSSLRTAARVERERRGPARAVLARAERPIEPQPVLAPVELPELRELGWFALALALQDGLPRPHEGLRRWLHSQLRHRAAGFARLYELGRESVLNQVFTDVLGDMTSPRVFCESYTYLFALLEPLRVEASVTTDASPRWHGKLSADQQARRWVESALVIAGVGRAIEHLLSQFSPEQRDEASQQARELWRWGVHEGVRMTLRDPTAQRPITRAALRVVWEHCDRAACHQPQVMAALLGDALPLVAHDPVLLLEAVGLVGSSEPGRVALRAALHRTGINPLPAWQALQWLGALDLLSLSTEFDDVRVPWLRASSPSLSLRRWSTRAELSYEVQRRLDATLESLGVGVSVPPGAPTLRAAELASR